MSESMTARDFHAHSGVGAWRVLFTGAHAHWRTDSLTQGGAFVAAIADAVADLDRAPDIDRPGRGRTHIDVSVPAEVGAAIVERAVAAGGRLVDERPGLWWTLASPENHGVDIAIWPDLTS